MSPLGSVIFWFVAADPLREMQLVRSVEAEDRVEVARRPVKVVFPLGQRVGITQLLQSLGLVSKSE